MRLVVVNPNTSESSTEAFVELAEAAASPGTTITGATGPFGVDLMRRPAELAIGVHAMLEAVAARIDDHDAVIIAAFGDYGAEAAADLFRKPVMTIAAAVTRSSRPPRRSPPSSASCRPPMAHRTRSSAFTRFGPRPPIRTIRRRPVPRSRRFWRPTIRAP